MISSSRLGWMIVAALACGCGGGAPAESTEPATSTAANEPSTSGDEQAVDAGEEPTFPMSTAEFLGMVTVEATPDVCGEGSPFRRCYPSLDAEQCAGVFARAMLACGEGMSDTLPETVDESTAEPIANAAGRCAGQAFTQGLDQAGVPRSAECQQPPAE